MEDAHYFSVSGNDMTDSKQFENSTIVNSKGQIIFFSLERFIKEIAKGDCCFICGASPTDKEFNNEHIIPDWVLRRFGLYNNQITLPNGTYIPYRQYTVPCCQDCNSQLGKEIETPVSQLLSHSYKEIIEKINLDKNLVYLIFRWISLIYLKTHLKDKFLPVYRDKRKGDEKIGDNHVWEEIHHIHCIARSHYTKAKINLSVFGTIFIFPVLDLEEFDSFDYIDSLDGKVVMVQIGDFCIVAVLDDACAGFTLFQNMFMKITGPLSPFQTREIVSHLNYINIHLKERPTFYSSFTGDGSFEINANVPKQVELIDRENELISIGELLHFYVKDMINDFDGKNDILESIRSGKRRYLFNENGEFINHANRIR